MAIQTREALEKEVQRVGKSFNFLGALILISLGVMVAQFFILPNTATVEIAIKNNLIITAIISLFSGVLFFGAGVKMKKQPTASDVPVYLYIIIALTLYPIIRALLAGLSTDLDLLSLSFGFILNIVIIGYAVYALLTIQKLKKIQI